MRRFSMILAVALWLPLVHAACEEEDPAPAGTLGCQLVFRCAFHCCPPGDTECVAACKAAGAVGTAAPFDALYACAPTACTAECANHPAAPPCEECIKVRCREHLAACRLGGGTGTGGCAQFFHCTTQCPDGVEDRTGSAQSCPVDPGILCVRDCVAGVDADSIPLVNALPLCEDDDACLTALQRWLLDD